MGNEISTLAGKVATIPMGNEVSTFREVTAVTTGAATMEALSAGYDLTTGCWKHSAMFSVSFSSVIRGKSPEFGMLTELGDIPFDVTFQILEADGNTMTEAGQGNGVKKREVKAHKFILAGSSPVFRAMFLGPMKESKDVIDVGETTFEAFEKLIGYIYQVDIECKDMSLVELYDIVNLAELYSMPKLMEELKIQMENINISADNLMEVAATASEYSQFETVSNAVLEACAKVLQRTLRNPASYMAIVNVLKETLCDQAVIAACVRVLRKTNQDPAAWQEFTELARTQVASGNGEVARLLLGLVAVKQLKPPVKCDNCKGKPCLRGQGVPYAKVRPGLRMRMAGYYPDDLKRHHPKNTDVTVLRVGPSRHFRGQVIVTGLDHTGRSIEGTYNPAWDDNGVPKMTFVYNC